MENPRRRRRRVLAWGSIGLVGFYSLSSAVMIPWVENDLTDRVEAAAVAAGYSGVTVAFSGQDGTIHCAEPVDEPAALVVLAEDRWGVRQAELADDCTRSAPAPAPTTAVTTTAAPTTAAPTTAAPSTTVAPTTTTAVTTTSAAPTTTAAAAGLDASAVLAAGSSRITLSGSVETQAQHDEVVAAATAAFGTGNVDDELVVLGIAARRDVEATGLAALISAMSPNLVEGTARFDGAALSLTGVYVTDEARAAVTAAATDVGVATDGLQLQPRATATADQAAQLESALNAAVGSSPIPFATGSASLTAEAGPILDQVAALAREYAGVTIAVNGHTDSDGSDSANLTLSRNRADTVRQALVERGVPADQLVAQGFGETEPIAPNDTPENKAQNRRVVFSVATP